MTNLVDFSSSLMSGAVWHGNHFENDRQTKLRAGSLSMIYENGNLRSISDGNNELIRMIYSAVRDREWLTITPVIADEVIENHSDSFRIEFNCLYKAREINFSARYLIEGHSDNTLIFSFEGVALDTFAKSRIGFCVLHPIESCSGRPCLISHSDGKSETLQFPVYISPDQPFTDIKSMNWTVAESKCTLIFSGELFETEDQRNWTDASYKTYCTPQILPSPATIRKGDKIWQRIEFIVKSEARSEVVKNEVINVSVNPLISFDMPITGIGRSGRPSPLSEDEIRILREVHFDHYRIDLYLFRKDWRDEADLAAGEATRLNWPLELALFFDENPETELADFIGWLTSCKTKISIITVLHKSEPVTPGGILDAFASQLKNVLPEVIVGCGTNANFAQINRELPGLHNADLFVYSVHPQEHASDNNTLVENLKGQYYTVESAKQIARGKGIWISTVNLQRRFNANIENYEPLHSGNEFPTQVDTRIMSLFGACWSTGSLKYLFVAGVRGSTYFETVGERGIIQGDFDSRWPEKFQTVKGMIFPVYHLFRYLLENKAYNIILSHSERPLEVDSLALSDGITLKLTVVNFTPSEQKILIPEFSGQIKIKVLNSESYSDASTDFKWIEKNWQSVSYTSEPLVSGPYSINFIEGFLINQGVERSNTE